MSYFDENYNGGSDDENKNSSSGSDSDTETNIDDDDEEVKIQEVPSDADEDDDLAEGKDTDNESDGGEDVADLDQPNIDEKEDGEDDQDDQEVGSDEEDIQLKKAPKKKTKKLPTTKQKGPTVAAMLADEEDDDNDPTGEVYLQKFDKEINDNYLVNFHPESAVHNYDEILAMTKVIRDRNGIIIDDLHKTIPYLTKYEKARVLGQRAKQINSGASVFVKVPEKVIDGYLIAELELQEKRVPFIIRRPLPNGASEYWSIKDLENISF